MTQVLRIVHTTTYRYDRPVSFGPHLLMLRPRDGHDMWVEEAFLTISPKAKVRWYFDTFGNSVAEATFTRPADQLRIVSELHLRRYPVGHRIAGQARHETPYPFQYSDEDAVDLARYMMLHDPQDHAVLTDWLDRAFPRRAQSSVVLLRRLSDTIHHELDYSARFEMGTQSAAETIASGQGTCRDFALLFMEAARILGFAARFVTGYLHDAGGSVGGGSTHAWADVYIQGEGWIEFDPTNRIIGGAELIRVATTRAPEQASPISGSYAGNAEFLGLDVSVEVTSEDT